MFQPNPLPSFPKASPTPPHPSRKVGTNKVDTANAVRGTGANAVAAAPSAEEAAALASSLAAATGAPPPTPGSTVVDTTIDDPSSLSSAEVAGGVREALRFIFSEDGEVFRDFLLVS